EQRADAVELEGVRAPHLGEEARAERPADRAPGMIRPHRHEEGRTDAEAPKELEQPRGTLVEAAARIDVDAQADGRAIGRIAHRRIPGRSARRVAHRSAASGTPSALRTRAIKSTPCPVHPIRPSSGRRRGIVVARAWSWGTRGAVPSSTAGYASRSSSMPTFVRRSYRVNAVSAGSMSIVRWATMSPASAAAVMWWSVTPVRGLPF